MRIWKGRKTMYELLKSFIRPELLALVPVLYLVGVALKKSACPDKHIPWLLGAAGVVFSLLFLAATSPDLSDWRNILLAVFSGVTQGILTAGASVYIHQVLKQAKKEE